MLDVIVYTTTISHLYIAVRSSSNILINFTQYFVGITFIALSLAILPSEVKDVLLYFCSLMTFSSGATDVQLNIIVLK